MIHHYCNLTFNNEDCTDDDFLGEDKMNSLKRAEKMGKEGLIPVSFGYKRMKLDELTFAMEHNDAESKEFKEDLLTDLSYLCTFGLENKLRLGVEEDVSLIKYGKRPDENEKRELLSGEFEGGRRGSENTQRRRKQNMVNVRMVTGDHFETARYVAHKAGIISKVEMQGKDVVMTGE